MNIKSSPIELYSRETRKANGVFYTPNFLAEYLSRSVLRIRGNNKPIRSVLDPACGDGALLSTIAKDVRVRNANDKIKLVGIDNDFNAIVSSTARFDSRFSAAFTTTFVQADSLFPRGGGMTEGWSELRNETHCPDGFDIALSNPPWGSDLSEYSHEELNSEFTLAKGQYDVYDLFVEIIFHNLAVDGTFGLILPDSIFGYEQSTLRRFLATKTRIHLISRLGEGLFSGINRACAIVIGSKVLPPSHHYVTCLRLSSNTKKKLLSSHLELENAHKKLSHRVPQQRFLKNQECLFDIELRDEEVSTFNKMADGSTPLSQLVSSTRGAEISKHGKTCRCSNCRLWLPFPKASNPRCSHCGSTIDLKSVALGKIVLTQGGQGRLKIKVGEDLFRYISRSRRWIDTMKAGINYKDMSIYQGAKILVRKTGVGITASIDYEDSLTNQVVYILKLNPAFASGLSLEFVLAVLNSRAMTFHLIKRYGESEWKTHPYLTQSAIACLPLPRIDYSNREHVRLISKATELIRYGVLEGKITKDTDMKLEKIVAKFFGLNLTDYESIFNTLRTAQQLIPIKRLLNCLPEEIFEADGI